MILVTLIEKGLGSARVTTRAKTLEVLSEIVGADTFEPIITELKNFVLHKQTKLASAVVNAVTEIVR